MPSDRFGIVSKVVARTYQVEDVVAEGGFGVVYRAYHKGFRAPVALKCLKIPESLGEEQRHKFLEQFRAEAEVLFRLSSSIPAIVRPLHVDAFRSQTGELVPFMALEWLEGRPLDAIISRRTEKGKPALSLKKLAWLLTPVAAALEQAHHFPGPNGIMTVVHRDLKPENLFVSRSGGQDAARILDFGISKVKSAASQLVGRLSLTSEAFVAFSPAYAAPEQLAPRTFGQTGKWTDVWGLALTVVEAAKGEEVVYGDHAQMMGVILSPERRPTPRNQGIEVTDEVERVFARAMALDPRHRTQTVGEFWDALTLVLGMQSETGTVSHRPVPGGNHQRIMTAGFDSEFPIPRIEVNPDQQRIPVDQARAGLAGAALGGEILAARPALLDATRREPRASVPEVAAQRPAFRQAVNIQESVPAPLSGLHYGAQLPPRRPVALAGEAGTQATGVVPRRSVEQRPPNPWRALSPALATMAFAFSLTVLDRAHALARGEPLELGPLKMSWIAAAIMVLGIGSGISALTKLGGR